MATVVIVHAAEDALPARALAEKLRAAQLTPVIEKYGADAREAARGAKVAIALWSPRSVGEASLIEDVGQIGAKVIHASMQNASPPAQFSVARLFNLTGWRGEDDFRPWRELADEVTGRAGVPPLPEPMPAAGASFFQPGRAGAAAGAPAASAAPRPAPQAAPRAAAPPPPPRPAPTARAEPRSAPPGEPAEKKSPIGIIAIVLIVLLAIGGGAYWYMNQSQGAAGASAWEDVAQNDAAEIRAFLAGNPGEYRDEAEAALEQLDQQTYDAAQEADSIEAFEAFLSEFPDSQNAIAARGRIAELRANPPVDPNALPEGELPPGETAPATDPDLVPPGSVTPLPEPEPDAGQGPATLTPPVPDPAAPATP